ncbi:hypothetical protein PDJAM_G00175700 [Pangasius djambal]|uniref:Uncharacterized protein n=1 Tax=Pangasius djambal TaxID=1691987 RepID=A0ACC5ZQF8_9TELE|nr:hypothetical protein [Pangasius djambal]
MASRYSWVIYKSKHFEKYIDAKRVTHANWMRYVNCAHNNEETNLVAFQYQGEIFYRCCRPIKPRQELLVWYEEKYAKNLDGRCPVGKWSEVFCRQEQVVQSNYPRPDSHQFLLMRNIPSESTFTVGMVLSG